MDFEIEQEMYIDPQIAEIKRQQEIKQKKKGEAKLLKAAAWKESRRRECVILAAWMLLFVTRYLKIMLMDGSIDLEQWFHYSTAYRIDSVVHWAVLVLNIVVCIACLYDFAKLIDVVEPWQLLLIGASWFCLRLVYLVIRGIALRDKNAIIRGGIWALLYLQLVCVYAVWYFEVVVRGFASCG